jgi:hypothetical protein
MRTTVTIDDELYEKALDVAFGQPQAKSGSRELQFACSKPALHDAISPARGLPLKDNCDAQVGEGVEVEPDWDMAAQAVLDYEVDQRINW